VDPSSAPAEVWTGPAIGALVVSAVAATIAAAGTIVGWVNGSRDRNMKTKEQQRSRKLQQLNELYAPLEAVRATTKRLRASLPQTEPGGGSDRWRLVSHLPEAFQSVEMKPVVAEIIKQNELAVALLRDQAGLIEGKTPASFEIFYQHQALLRLCWDNQGQPVGLGGVRVSDVPFPDQIDSDIADGRRSVEAALVRLESE